MGPSSKSLQLVGGQLTADSPYLNSFAGQELEVGGHRIKFTCVSMGNPHAVTYTIDGQPIKVWVGEVGRASNRVSQRHSTAQHTTQLQG